MSTKQTLVIAEKPSVAKSIAAVLKATNRKDGYLEGGGFLVSWCVGHLVELADASAYDERYAKWSLTDLPILPERWKYGITPDTKKQFDTLKQLMEREDVASLVCATDAGREGELIFRLVYEQAKCKKPVKRLWISSMEDSAIREGFEHLRSSADYDNLYRAALCRARADWLVGINATRLFSCLYHRTLNIGRVMTPTLALIVKREADIDAFKPTPFYTVTLGLSDFAATGERLTDKAQAEVVQAVCMAADAATVKSVERKEKTEKPPALYDLTTLQREANRLLGFTAQQTLDYLQSLYEKKLATYPRTDSRYLTSDMAQSLPVLVNIVAKAMPFASGVAVYCNPAQVINDAKVGDHHAIIPTQGVKDADLSGLPAGERSLLSLIAARLLCAVGQPYAYAETAVVVECAGYEFKTKGRAVLNPGFKELDGRYRDTLKNKPEPDKEKEAKALPVLAEGQSFEVMAAGIKEGKTTPPAHFTEDSLLAAMETAGAGDMPEDAERKGLGTPATRAGILEKLIKVGFLERKKVKKATHLMPTHAGVALITVLPEQIQSPSMTAEWEHQLKEIERGGAEPEAFLDGITAMLKDLIKHYEVVKDASVLFPSEKESLGKCPRCGGSVVELKKGFVCENRDCGFAIWKENKFFTAKKKKPTAALVTELLASGRAKLSGCYSEKTGKTYDAVVVLDDDGGKYVNFKLEFASGGKSR
ncbi:DNA topoisomerase III [Ruthenibacterium lactatiformans]|uniref:DNA topoisomerase n=1 Tax=Ruthenibacterium lactatiformans TaxID=1550024 RepID=A0A0W7TS55_9FIRM|nr:type IA DNA topoisomerase [Ruthenibacterium lactatiformans]KUE76682.1 DNA topoisomerase III [Ruthenibacterium lactatiformans]